MIKKYLKREDVSNLIKEIKRNPRYYEKEKLEDNISIGNELSLYILYDALLKFKIVIDDDSLFDDFIVQLDKLYKKIDNYDQIVIGINKLICYMTIKLFNIRGMDEKENKNKVIEHVYNKYILGGYYVHGFSTVYENSIKDNGFISEFYINYYQQFNDVKKIFEKYGMREIIEKDFSSNKSYFTDNFIMGCHYSAMAPMYFTNMLFNNLYGNSDGKDGYLKLDYDSCISHLKRFMSDKSFDRKDMDYVLYIVKKEWDLLFRVNKKISLMLVKRSFISFSSNNIGEYLNSNEDLYEIVDGILSSKNGNIVFDGTIEPQNIEVVSLENFYDIDVKNINRITINDKDEDLPYKNRKEIMNREFLDAYGKVYIFLVFGSLFISLGVIITIIMIIRGI